MRFQITSREFPKSLSPTDEGPFGSANAGIASVGEGRGAADSALLQKQAHVEPTNPHPRGNAVLY